MIFYGFGRKNKAFPMRDGLSAVATYRYVSLMFIFQVAYGVEWHLIGRDRAGDQQVTHDQLRNHYGESAPSLSLWSRYGLLMAAGAFLLVMVTFALMPG